MSERPSQPLQVAGMSKGTCREVLGGGQASWRQDSRDVPPRRLPRRAVRTPRPSPR
jgi:hypothetical protein